MKRRFSRSGVHLFDRMSGLNILLDEHEVPRSQWSVAPRFASIALTNACDLSCSFCYAPKHRASLLQKDVLRWARELDAAGCLGVGFGGGEPTIYSGFVELCRSIATTTELAVSFTSHGQALTAALCEKLTGNVHFARFSMDGIGKTYERSRSASFTAFLANVTNARNAFPFGINYVVNSETVRDLDQAVDIILGLGASELLLLPERPTAARTGIDDATADILNDWIHNNFGRMRLSISSNGVVGDIPIACAFPKETAIDSYVHIDANATLKVSSYDAIGIPISDMAITTALVMLRNRSEEVA